MDISEDNLKFYLEVCKSDSQSDIELMFDALVHINLTNIDNINKMFIIYEMFTTGGATCFYKRDRSAFKKYFDASKLKFGSL